MIIISELPTGIEMPSTVKTTNAVTSVGMSSRRPCRLKDLLHGLTWAL